MKISSVINKTEKNKRAAFTLIEMIGVLAVIAILASLLIPRVFNAIADAKINNTVVGAETVKTALADHYGKYGKFDSVFGTNNITTFPTFGYDTNVLVAEGLLDKPFQTKLGTNWTIQIRQCATAATAPDVATPLANAAYNLGSTNVNDVVGQYVLEAVISGVAEADAQAISQRLDGISLSSAAINTSDTVGRVKYAAANGGNTTVYIYLTHR